MKKPQQVVKSCLYLVRKKKCELGFRKRINEAEAQVQSMSNAVILIGTPEYHNLGDHLIATAIMKFWRDKMPDSEIIEITRELYEKYPQRVEKLILALKSKTILITGGGFLGNLWMEMENMVRKIISISPLNRLVIFPQTIYFTEDEIGNTELRNSRILYNSLHNLCFYVRDKNSYNLVISNGLVEKDDCMLVPDMALYLPPMKPYIGERNGIFLCLRHDKESTLDSTIEKHIESIVKNVSSDRISYGDTVYKYGFISAEKRETEIAKFVKKIYDKKLVITNRLHCMIFCFLTGTPCVAIDNLSLKIIGVYKWIQNCKYIKCIDKDNFTADIITEMLNIQPAEYAGTTLKVLFDQMACDLKGRTND